MAIFNSVLSPHIRKSMGGITFKNVGGYTIGSGKIVSNGSNTASQASQRGLFKRTQEFFYPTLRGFAPLILHKKGLVSPISRIFSALLLSPTVKSWNFAQWDEGYVDGRTYFRCIPSRAYGALINVPKHPSHLVDGDFSGTSSSYLKESAADNGGYFQVLKWSLSNVPTNLAVALRQIANEEYPTSAEVVTVKLTQNGVNVSASDIVVAPYDEISNPEDFRPADKGVACRFFGDICEVVFTRKILNSAPSGGMFYPDAYGDHGIPMLTINGYRFPISWDF